MFFDVFRNSHHLTALESVLMQSSNQVESPVQRCSPFSTSSLFDGSVPAASGGPAACDTEDYPEITVDLSSAEAAGAQTAASAPEAQHEGAESEQILWEGRTSPKNFLVRFLVGEASTIAWVGLAVATWGFGYENLSFLTYALGFALLLFWALTGIRVFRAIHSHYYRLTSRRLFVTTGFFRRRIDQIELLRVKDLFVQQNMIGSWLGLGHVVVISSEPTLRRATLFGIAGPRFVMDLIWRQARWELDRKTSRIESV
jgi:hypothetical protein